LDGFQRHDEVGDGTDDDGLGSDGRLGAQPVLEQGQRMPH